MRAQIHWKPDTVGGDSFGYLAYVGSIRMPVGGVKWLIPRNEHRFKAYTRLPGGDPFEEEASMAMAQEKFENYLNQWFSKALGGEYVAL